MAKRTQAQKAALNFLKFQMASNMGINLTNGYNGDLSARQCGYIGAAVTKELIRVGLETVSKAFETSTPPDAQPPHYSSYTKGEK